MLLRSKPGLPNKMAWMLKNLTSLLNTMPWIVAILGVLCVVAQGNYTMRKPYRKSPLNKPESGMKNDNYCVTCHASDFGV